MNRTKAIPFALEEEKWRAPYFLSPVAGYSDIAFRAICTEFGAALCYTEMISAEALVRGHPRTKELLARDPIEVRYAVQLFGADPGTLAKAAQIVSVYNPVVIDLNCGCPVPKIIKAGAGSALLRTPARIGEIVRAMRDATAIPISVKLRTGWDQNSINYFETSRAAVEAGACAITLHGRTRAQGYSGSADWSAIKALVAQTSVPVFGSGDIFSAKDALAMRRITGCHGVMIARGAIGNPFIFTKLKTLATEPEAEPSDRPLSPRIIAQTVRHHLALAIQYLGEKNACIEFRKHFCAYTKGLPGGAELRARAVHCTAFSEYEPLFQELENSADSQPYTILRSATFNDLE